MSKRTLAYLIATAAMFLATTSRAAILFDDNFDSYANQAAFAAAWPTHTAGTANLSTAQAYSGTQSANLPLTATRWAKAMTADTAPTAALDIQFSFRFYDDLTAQGRQGAEIIDGAGSATGQLVGIGTNNTPASTKYFYRFLGVQASYVPLDASSPNRSLGWHEMKALIHFVNATTESIDIYVDGVLSTSQTGASLRSFDAVRLGTNTSSTNQAWIDDMHVETVPVPEPAAIGMLGLAAIGLLRRRRA